MRGSRRLSVSLVVAGLLFAAAPAHAIPVVVDGGWVSFTFEPSEIGGPWTFAAGLGGVTLTVLDRYVHGERWSVYDDGGLIGSTSVVPIGGTCEGNVDACFADPNSSKGFFDLAPGAHSITLEQIAGSFTSGSLRVDSLPVPEPGTALLVATGAIGLALRRGKRVARNE